MKKNINIQLVSGDAIITGKIQLKIFLSNHLCENFELNDTSQITVLLPEQPSYKIIVISDNYLSISKIFEVHRQKIVIRLTDKYFTHQPQSSSVIREYSPEIKNISQQRNIVSTSGQRGYFMTGQVGNYYSYSITELNFLTKQIKELISRLSQARSKGTAVQSSQASYITNGEHQSSFIDTIEKFLFYTEYFALLSATLSILTESSTSVSSATQGFIVGGLSSFNLTIGNNQLIDFSNDTTQLMVHSLMTTRAYAAASESHFYGKGFIGGGAHTQKLSDIETFNFSTGHFTLSSATLTVPRSGLAGNSSSEKGYYAGGTYYQSVEIDGLKFDTETSINPSATLSYDRQVTSVYATSQGYFVGGEPNATIDELSFLHETVQVLSQSIPYHRKNGVGTQCNQSITIYPTPTPSLSESVTPSTTRTESKTPSVTSISATPSVTPSQSPSSSSAPTVKGYFGGGLLHSGQSEATQIIDAFLFPSETIQSPSIQLNAKLYGMSGLNNVSQGYFMGGILTDNSIDSAQKLIFYPETISTIYSALSIKKGFASAINSPHKGFTCGGQNIRNYTEFPIHIIDGWEFVTETKFNPNLSLQTSLGTVGVGDVHRGFICGSQDQMAGKIEILNYATETLSTSASVLNVRYPFHLSATQSSYVGYLAYSNDVLLLDFNTEVVSNIQLTENLGEHDASIHTAFQGYFSGGVSDAMFLNQIKTINFQTNITYPLTAYLSCPRRSLTGIMPEMLMDPPPTQTPTPSTTITLSNSPTGSITPTPTATTTSTPSMTSSITPTSTLTESPTQTPTNSSTLTESPTASPTPSTTLTESPTPTPTSSTTLTESPTQTPTPSTTITETMTETPSTTSSVTESPSESPTPSTTLTESPTQTPTPSTTITESPTVSPTPSTTLTESPTQTPTPSTTITETMTETPSTTSSVTESPTPSTTKTETPSNTPSNTASPSPSALSGPPTKTGLFMGGYNVTPQAKIDVFEFITEYMSPTSYYILSARSQSASISSDISGYMAGGFANNYISDVLFVDFDQYFISNLYLTLTMPKRSSCGLQNVTKGYICGGENGLGFVTSHIDKLIFYGNAIQPMTQSLIMAIENTCGINSVVQQKGYICGGFSSQLTTEYVIQEMNYSTELTTFYASSLSNKRGGGAGLDDATRQVSFIIEGEDIVSGFIADIEKINHSTNTITTSSAVVHIRRTDIAGIHDNVDNGFISGGFTYNYRNEIEKLNYAVEAITVLSAVISTPRRELSGCQPL